jgi:hypothetical protein
MLLPNGMDTESEEYWQERLAVWRGERAVKVLCPYCGCEGPHLAHSQGEGEVGATCQKCGARGHVGVIGNLDLYPTASERM